MNPKKISNFFTGLLLAVVLMFAAILPTTPAIAATPNYSTAIGGVVVIPLHISGQYIATTTGVTRFAMPFKARLVGVGASARASGGTAPTLTVDLLDDGTSALSSAISVTAGSYTEGTIANAVVADESVITVNFAITGTSPTWNDITIFITLLRE